MDVRNPCRVPSLEKIWLEYDFIHPRLNKIGAGKTREWCGSRWMETPRGVFTVSTEIGRFTEFGWRGVNVTEERRIEKEPPHRFSSFFLLLFPLFVQRLRLCELAILASSNYLPLVAPSETAFVFKKIREERSKCVSSPAQRFHVTRSVVRVAVYFLRVPA